MKKTDKILKFICGAGNEDLIEIEKLSFIYAAAGFNMIDVAAKTDVINMAKSGVKKAGMEHEVSICVSVGLQEDIHVSKVVINQVKCNHCGLCLKECKRNAIFKEDDKFLTDEKKCIGCSKCISVCPCEAIINEHKYKSPSEMLLPLLSENIDCVEFHCTSEDETKILENWNRIKTIYSGQLSICLNRSKLGDEGIIKLLGQMIQDNEDVIIQADGNPMSGSVNDYKSNLQTVSFAELIRNAGLTPILILSGGTNAKTSEFAKMCGVEINGVAIGSYARKLVNQYISREDFWQNQEVKELAINTAKGLSSSLLASL